MAEIINLVDGNIPDCRNCRDPTKRETGAGFDMEFPGSCTTMYDCGNRRCKALRKAKMLIFLNNLLYEEEIANENGTECP